MLGICNLYGTLHDIVAKLIAIILAPKALILDYCNIKTGRNVGAAAGGWGKWLLKARLEQLSRSATYTA
jgi:hypothetical protein